jgi:uncharacterized MnhB-related membrane protein
MNEESAMLYLLVLIVMLFCAIQAIRAAPLLIAALWLAGASALLAVLMYGLGAREVAVIELSVGAGLVTVLFIFAISLAGDDPLPARPVVPRLLAAVLLAVFALLILVTVPVLPSGNTASNTTFAEVFWHERSADALAQIALIFAGALSVLGFLVERRARAQARRWFVPTQEPALHEERQP